MESINRFRNVVVPKICGGYNGIGKNKSQTIDVYSGGNKYSRAVGEECEFHMRDILISLKYIELDNLDSSEFEVLGTDEKRENIFKKLSDIFRLKKSGEESILKEIKYLLSLSDEKLSYIYVRRFKLYFVFSDSIKPLFMSMKDYFQDQVKILADELNIDFKSYVNKWTEIDKKENIGSSSVVLYQLGKDKSFTDDIKEKAHNLETNTLIDYITDINKWRYLGFCPYEPTLRMRHLLDFPLDMFFNMMSDPKYVEEQVEKIRILDIQNIQTPEPPFSSKSLSTALRGVRGCPSTDIQLDSLPYSELTNEQIIELIEKLICRLDSIKPILQTWEKYYINFSKIYSDLSKKFYDTF